ncbi:hypothetical protein QQX98_011219 [Neonectria punicea]|uniref:Pyrroloquinoline quinone-dependent pyranose dehydrogenase beta-propeller domain-containing protein n=1 Tax=Neonectria punicea TaxID=979145 RepID=A0ABR1GMF8_9HYPO
MSLADALETIKNVKARFGIKYYSANTAMPTTATKLLHSVDNLRRRGEDIHKDNLGEELNFHGYLNHFREDQGGNYGFPLCYTIWSTDNFLNHIQP